MKTNFNELEETITKFETKLAVWEEKNRQLQRKREVYAQMYTVFSQAEKDILKYTSAIKRTDEFYSKERKKQIKLLEKEITSTVNAWFNNKYNFEFKEYRKNGSRGIKGENSNVYYKLIDTIRNNGKASLVCGGGCQQTLGTLLSICLNNIVGAGTIVFDETFNSYGVKERERIPELIRNTLKTKQVLIIDHNFQALGEDEATIYYVTRNDDESSKVVYVDQRGDLNPIIAELQCDTITKEDLLTLSKFNIPIENSSRYYDYKQLQMEEN